MGFVSKKLLQPDLEILVKVDHSYFFLDVYNPVLVHNLMAKTDFFEKNFPECVTGKQRFQFERRVGFSASVVPNIYFYPAANFSYR